MNGDTKKVIIAVLITAILATAGTVIAHEVRLGKMESNIYTATDGARLEGELRAWGFNLEGRLKDWMETRFPPAWMKEDLTELKQLVRSNGKKIDEHIAVHVKNGK
jgi:hypothetical protein